MPVRCIFWKMKLRSILSPTLTLHLGTWGPERASYLAKDTQWIHDRASTEPGSPHSCLLRRSGRWMEWAGGQLGSQAGPGSGSHLAQLSPLGCADARSGGRGSRSSQGVLKPFSQTLLLRRGGLGVRERSEPFQDGGTSPERSII